MGYTPRQTRVDEDHVIALLEVIDHLPPIIVDERMIVIDGVHRIEAFRRAGRHEISAHLFVGNEIEAVAIAVQANVQHGKPLSRTERQAAARTLLGQCPERSDRWIAEICGLSHPTVAALRQVTDGANQELRTGRDGRRRPLDRTAGQAAVIEALARDPASSRRQTAKAAGVAPSTAHRLATGWREQQASRSQLTPPSNVRPRADSGADAALARSEALTGTEWLEETALMAEEIRARLKNVPMNRIYEAADECRRRARLWADMADDLDKQARSSRALGFE
jgi:ParB-like chromosome segregation protein Spo0J